MVQTLLRILLVVAGVALSAWLVVIERAFADGFAKFKERAPKPGSDNLRRTPMNPDKIVV